MTVVRYSDSDWRARIIAEARDWITTPYQHQASCKGAGVDCLGLVRGIWRTVIGPEPAHCGHYSPDWAETSESDTMIDGLGRHFVQVEHPEPGDVLAFRMLETGPAKHLAILSTELTQEPTPMFIHAYSGLAVCEARLSMPWLRRVVAAFRFPNPE